MMPGDCLERTDNRGNDRVILGLICLLAIVKGLIFSSIRPIWSPIDEMQHFHYIQYVAETGHLPIQGETLMSRENKALGARLHSSEKQGWPPHLESDPDPEARLWLGSFSYEAWQPPLYYFLMTPLYLISGPGLVRSIHLLRAANIFIMALTVLFTYRIAKAVFPYAESVALGSALLVALIPGFSGPTTQITNDSLSGLFGAVVVFLTLRHGVAAHFPTKSCAIIGLLLGLSVLVKINGGFLLPPVLLVIVLDAVVAGRKVGSLAKSLIIVMLLFLVTVTPWLLWNFAHYGALTAAAVQRQLLPMKLQGVPELSWQWLARGLRILIYGPWHSGRVGGMWPFLSRLTRYVTNIGIALSGWLLFSEFVFRKADVVHQISLLFILVTAIVTFAGVLGGPFYTKADVIECRFLLPGLAPISVLFTAGFPLVIPERHRRYWLLAFLAFLLFMNVVCIVPTFLHYYSFNFYPRIHL